MTVLLKSLPQGFGAEVHGFDPQHGRSPADIAGLQDALLSRGLLVFRQCGRLSPQRQAQIIGWFGTVGAGSLPDGEVSTTMDNASDRGRARLPFHSDITFFRYPLQGISLHPLELPTVDTSTTYISNALAWDTLSVELRETLRDRKARHYYRDDGKIGSAAQVFETWHPVCMPHYRTGRPLLFVTEHHVDQIEGFSREEGAELLQRLFAHLYAPARQYEHVWREGDLVVWDNYAIQHARTREADPAEGRRLLQRVWFGEYGFSDQLEQLLKRESRAV
jgi:alpha-ketoglutarate-dependent taurine dioxygenase